MGQSGYQPYNGGGGSGSNLWVQNGDTSLSPVAGSIGIQIPDNVNPQFTATTNFIQANIGAALGFLRWGLGLFGYVNIAQTDDGGGNNIQTKQSFNIFSSIATSSLNFITRIIHGAGNASIDSTDPAGNSGQMNLTSGTANMIVSQVAPQEAGEIGLQPGVVLMVITGAGGVTKSNWGVVNDGVLTDSVLTGAVTPIASYTTYIQLYNIFGVPIGKIPVV